MSDITLKNPVILLIGVLSCRRNFEHRQAIRETWGTVLPSGVHLQFFVGKTDKPIESDVLCIDIPDDRRYLAGKTLEFYRWAVTYTSFQYLFKCDDDTYVDVLRVFELMNGCPDLVGNHFINNSIQPHANGGAGYLVSRAWIEKLIQQDISSHGEEDTILTGRLLTMGVTPKVNSLLHWQHIPYPMTNNQQITAHYCPANRMRAIHTFRYASPSYCLDVHHAIWRDTLQFYPNQFFRRMHTGCYGVYEPIDGGIRLDWFDWKAEVLIQDACRWNVLEIKNTEEVKNKRNDIASRK